MALGSLSELGSEIGEARDFDSRWDSSDPQSNWCLAYGRDRGEPNTGHHVFNNSKDFVAEMSRSGCEYFYLWANGRWQVTKGSLWSDLAFETTVE
jgi:hypothetical protein